MKNFKLRDLWWLVILLLVLPAYGTAQARKRGVKLSYVFLALAVLALIARIVWVAVHK